jgi:hypothetical protein
MRLRGLIVSGAATFPVTVASLSEGGFYCEGPDLEKVASPMRLAVRLESREPSWRPNDPDCPWQGDDSALEGRLFESMAEVLYLDLYRADAVGSAMVGLGGRFCDLPEEKLEVLREFVSRELFRTRDWRTRGGAVHVPPDGGHPLFR